MYKIAKTQAGWNKSGPPTSLIIGGKNIASPGGIAQAQMNYYTDKNRKLLENIEGEQEVDPLENLRTSVDKWTQRGKQVSRMKLEEITTATTAKMI